MPEAVDVAQNHRKLDRRILLSLALSPLGAGISTIVGYIVAHWITITGHKNTGYVVSASSFVFCVAAASLAWSARRELTSPDETRPEEGHRLFMTKLALLLSALCILVVLAGTLVLITLGPND
jgi:uncharacterized membrane protein